MEPVKKLQLVHLSSDELKANSDKIVVLPQALLKELADKFYGGYSSGTAPMGYVPNAIILKE